MRQSTTDLMVEYAVACLAADDHHRINVMVANMARSWPNEAALGIAFAITTAASSYEDTVDTRNSKQSAQRGYRMAALVAADVYAIEAMGQFPAKAQDLLHFWRRVDPYFLEF